MQLSPYMSLSFSSGASETETFWNGFTPGAGGYDGCSKGGKGHRRCMERRGSCSRSVVLLLMWLAAETSPVGNLRMSREVMARMMPVRLSTHFHNGC